MKNSKDMVNEKLPLLQMIPLGIQHILAMYAGAVVVPLMLGAALGLSPKDITIIISMDLFVCGISTLIQVLGIGNFAGIKLPVILGCAFTAVGPMIMIGQSSGIEAIYGSVIAAGIFVTIFAFFFGKLLKFFPPVVIGSVITIIGLSLLPVAIKNAAGGEGASNFGAPENLAVALFVLVTIVLINKFFSGFMQAISVLSGIVIGTVVAGFLGMVDVSLFTEAEWFKFSAIPFHFGAPKFEISGILTMSLVAIVSMIESTGVFFATGKVCEREITEKDVVKGLRAEGLAQVIGGVFNTFPYSTFSQNVGVIALTGVKSRYVVLTAGFMLIALSFLPKFAALAIMVPEPVLGGAMIAMFGMVAMSGIRTLSSVDLSKNNNLLVAGCAIGIGIGVAVVPGIFAQMPQLFRILFENGIVSGSVTAIVLNLILNWNELKNPLDATSVNDEVALS